MNEYDGNDGLDFFCVVYQDFYPDIKGSRSLLLHDGRVLTEQDTTKKTNFIEYVNEHYKGSYLENLKTPKMIFSGLGSISQIENYKLNEEILEHIKTHGLHFYLYETLVFDIGSKKKFYVLENENYRAVHFRYAIDLTDENLKKCYSYELDSIQQFAVNNGIKNIDVFTVEYGSHELFNDKYPNITVRTKDIFLISVLKEKSDAINCFQINDSLIDKFSSDIIQYKFWSSNWRYDLHRHLIVLYLAHRSCVFSWAFGDSIFQLKENLWFDIELWRQHHPEIYRIIKKNDVYVSDNAPFIIDVKDVVKTPVKLNQIWTVPEPDVFSMQAQPLPEDSVRSAFVVVVNETCFAQPLGTFSEKITNAMKIGRPFVVVAPPRTLEYIRKLGFKTFSDFWDEGYDQELDHEKRMLKIFKVIDHIDLLSIEELKHLYDQMLPIIHHNFHHLKTIKTSNLIL